MWIDMHGTISSKLLKFLASPCPEGKEQWGYRPLFSTFLKDTNDQEKDGYIVNIAMTSDWHMELYSVYPFLVILQREDGNLYWIDVYCVCFHDSQHSDSIIFVGSYDFDAFMWAWEKERI